MRQRRSQVVHQWTSPIHYPKSETLLDPTLSLCRLSFREFSQSPMVPRWSLCGFQMVRTRHLSLPMEGSTAELPTPANQCPRQIDTRLTDWSTRVEIRKQGSI